MNHQVALTSNVRRLSDAAQELTDRDPATPGIAVVWGRSGFGKTTAIKWSAVQSGAVYVRALDCWSPATMCRAIMRELGSVPLTSTALMVEWIAKELSARGLALYVDECDYLVTRKHLVETLRDIHDLSTQPLILVGMREFLATVKQRPQLSGRVSQTVEFLPATDADVTTLANTLCEVPVEADLLAQLHRESAGSVRLVVVGLARVEGFAKRNGHKAVSVAQWGDRPLTLLGSAR
jgi:DNA transposition AAA+ family ATPase